MSVVVRDDATGVHHVVSKGAESAILPKVFICNVARSRETTCVSLFQCTSGPVGATQQVVDSFASEGLRTLVFGHKIIGEEEYEAFKANLAAAK